VTDGVAIICQGFSTHLHNLMWLQADIEEEVKWCQINKLDPFSTIENTVYLTKKSELVLYDWLLALIL
jgi:hypothetical protein